MSAINVKQFNQDFLTLKSLFDDVVLDEDSNNKYATLTLRDKVCNNDFIDWEVWLEIKVPKFSKATYSDELEYNFDENLNRVVEEILKFQTNLFTSKNTTSQTGLFDDVTVEEEEEKEPEHPKDDKGWNKYFKEKKAYNKRKVDKLPFLEVANLWSSPMVYDNIDFIPLLPKDSEEMISIAKEKILYGYNNPSIENDFFDEYNYVKSDEALSDRELFDRVMLCMRINLLPYESSHEYYVDDDYNFFEIGGITHHKFYFDYGRLSEHPQYESKDLPQYNLYQQHFIDWLRDLFQVQKVDVVEDYVPLDETAKQLFKTMIHHCDKEYDKAVEDFANYKKFKSDFISFYKKSRSTDSINCGGTGYSIDGFSSYYNVSGINNLDINVRQGIDFRKSINRNVDDLEKCSFNEDEVYVFNISNDECYEAIYNAYNRDKILENKVDEYKIVQTTLFDFL